MYALWLDGGHFDGYLIFDIAFAAWRTISAALEPDRAARTSFPLRAVFWVIMLIDTILMVVDGEFIPTVACVLISLFAEYATTIRTIPPRAVPERERKARAA